VIVIYRPPYSVNHQIPTGVFFTEFSDYLESFLRCKEQLQITGDFNFHLNDNQNIDALKFLDLLETFNLQQHVTNSTHLHGNILDLIITRTSEELLAKPPRIERFISDHACIICQLNSPRTQFSVKNISYRKVKTIDIHRLKNDIKESALNLTSEDIDDTIADTDALAHVYNKTLSALLDDHAPLKSTIRPTMPWYNNEIDDARKKRRKAERKWRKSRRAEDLVMFKRLKNYVTHLINKARRDFYTEFVNENSSNQTSLFRAANKLLTLKNNNLSFPKQMDRNILVNDIGKLFVHKIIKVRAETDSTDVDEIDRALVPTNPQIDDEGHGIFSSTR
jgi:hypothetical protein